MKRTSKLLSLLLAALMLASSMVACSSGDDPADTSGAADSADTTVAEETTADPLADPFTGVTYDGYNFRLYGHIGDTVVFSTIYREEEKGETVNDAVFNRNKAIEDKFKIKISHVQAPCNDMYNIRNEVLPIISAGDDFCDLICAEGMDTVYKQNGLVNLREVDVFDFSKPWWLPAAESQTINNKLFTVQSAIAYNMLAYARVIYMNVDLAKNNNIAVPYDDVRAGTWYLDDWIKMTKDVYKDVNGNGAKDWNDVYGMSMSGKQWTTVEALGIETVIENEQKTALVDNVMSPEYQKFLEKSCSWLFGGNPGFLFRTSAKSGEAILDQFTNGTLLTMSNFMQNPIKVMDKINFEYTIIPFPKLDENQKDYRVASTGNNFAIPTTVKDITRTATIVEDMSRLGYIDVFPAYKDLALRGRYSSNQDCADMIDIIADRVWVSFANMNVGSSAPQHLYWDVWADQKDTPEFASKYAAKQGAIAKDIAKLNEFYYGTGK
ncbi:MAG: hypothetical protein E7662_01730 [Ruminococcaceae bacterium]|nr:hypothetical protein [Oscillospiraceae bacterium]